MGTNLRGGTGGSATHPELSIVVTCFNQGELLDPCLRECFQIVASQVASFEAVVINDGSTDGSVRILDRIRKEFPHVRVTHQLHSGRAKALRRGYDLARGHYVFQFDLSEPQRAYAFPALWEKRDRYALILGYQPQKAGRIYRTLTWLEGKWIRLWFGAELQEPDSTSRLCQRDLFLGYLQLIPKEYEGLDLILTLATFRDDPRLLLEVETPAQEGRMRYLTSEVALKFFYHFIEIAALRWKLPSLKPAERAELPA